jgi:hypothetical protein
MRSDTKVVGCSKAHLLVLRGMDSFMFLDGKKRYLLLLLHTLSRFSFSFFLSSLVISGMVFLSCGHWGEMENGVMACRESTFLRFCSRLFDCFTHIVGRGVREEVNARCQNPNLLFYC